MPTVFVDTLVGRNGSAAEGCPRPQKNANEALTNIRADNSVAIDARRTMLVVNGMVLRCHFLSLHLYAASPWNLRRPPPLSLRDPVISCYVGLGVALHLSLFVSTLLVLPGAVSVRTGINSYSRLIQGRFKGFKVHVSVGEHDPRHLLANVYIWSSVKYS